MSDVKAIAPADVKPVAVGVVKKAPPSLTIKMVNTRASHFYFKRVFQLLKSMGKIRK